VILALNRLRGRGWEQLFRSRIPNAKKTLCIQRESALASSRFGIYSNINDLLHLVIAFFARPEMKDFVFVHVARLLRGNQ
jgi:hypothetical protein